MGAVRSGADLRGRPEVGGGRDLCGAGFTPASGGGTVAQLWTSPPSAGINPAPHRCRGRAEIGAGAGPCGAGFTPASGGGTAAQVGISAPSAGINPAPQVTQPSRSWRWRRSDLCGAVAQVG